MSRVTRSSAGHDQNHGDGRDGEDSLNPPLLTEVMLEIERNKHATNRLLDHIERNTAHQCNELVSIRDFIKLNPPTFHHSIEPLDADDWLRSINNKLRYANVAEGDKVTYATYHLEGSASLWWENFEAMRPSGQVTSWQEFCEAFREHHIP